MRMGSPKSQSCRACANLVTRTVAGRAVGVSFTVNHFQVKCVSKLEVSVRRGEEEVVRLLWHNLARFDSTQLARKSQK